MTEPEESLPFSKVLFSGLCHVCGSTGALAIAVPCGHVLCRRHAPAGGQAPSTENPVVAVAAGETCALCGGQVELAIWFGASPG